MSNQWRIIVSGEWFYGTKEECLRERAEFESTFTAEDFEDYEKVVPEQVYSLSSDITELQRAVITQTAEIARLKAVTNFQDAVACVFDYLKFAAANTSSREWGDQLEDLAEDVIEFAPEYKKQWKDICALQGSLRASEKKNEGLTLSLAKAVDMLYETSMDHSRINRLLAE